MYDKVRKTRRPRTENKVRESSAAE